MDWKKAVSSNASKQSIVFILFAVILVSINGAQLYATSGLFRASVKGNCTDKKYLYFECTLYLFYIMSERCRSSKKFISQKTDGNSSVKVKWKCGRVSCINEELKSN